MSKLRIATRAVSHSEEWRDILQAACTINGVEYTDQLAFQVSYEFADDILIDPNTLVVDTSFVEDHRILSFIESLKPPVEPEPEEEIIPDLEPESEE